MWDRCLACPAFQVLPLHLHRLHLQAATYTVRTPVTAPSCMPHVSLHVWKIYIKMHLALHYSVHHVPPPVINVYTNNQRVIRGQTSRRETGRLSQEETDIWIKSARLLEAGVAPHILQLLWGNSVCKRRMWLCRVASMQGGVCVQNVDTIQCIAMCQHVLS
jgi:hypothetical protein